MNDIYVRSLLSLRDMLSGSIDREIVKIVSGEERSVSLVDVMINTIQNSAAAQIIEGRKNGEAE